MVKLNLKANTKSEEIIKDYLENNASETLAEKINKGVHITKDEQELINKKSLNGFMKFATEEAKKVAEQGANFACIDDKTVFGWVIHYFEEDSIEGTLYDLNGEEYKPKVEIPKVTQSAVYTPKPLHKVEDKQQNLFDIMFNDTEENKQQDTVETAEQEPIKEEIELDDTGIMVGEMYYGTSEQKPTDDYEIVDRLKQIFGNDLVVR